MTSEAKFRLILMVFLAVLALGGLGLFVVYRYYPSDVLNENIVTLNANAAIQTNTPLQNTNAVVVNTNTPVVNTNIIPSAPISDEARVTALAKSFTERYGSFSNQNENENLVRLLVYMTAKLQAKTQEFITAQQVKNENTDVYYGVTTDAVSTRFEEFTSEKAIVFVSTRRRASKEGEAAVVSSQAGRIVLVKINGEWFVDKFDWQ